MTHKSKDWDDVPSILNSICWQLKCIAEELNTYNQSQQPAQPTAPNFVKLLKQAGSARHAPQEIKHD